MKTRDPWICPRCGRKLHIRNQEHTCNLHDFETHFVNKDPIGRIAYDWITETFDKLGAYDVLPMKTMIAFANGSNIAFLVTKKKGVEISFVLNRPLSSKRIKSTTPYSKSKTIYRALITDKLDLDQELQMWFKEAFAASLNVPKV